jgi:hypothetical protein
MPHETMLAERLKYLFENNAARSAAPNHRNPCRPGVNFSVMRISFCITCMGRLHHLQQTLPKNLEWTAEVAGVEFVILNYSSPDELDNWVCKEMRGMIATERVNYFRSDGFTHYNSAHAKNVAHRVAAGEIVCNLDADNFVGAGFAEFLRDTFAVSQKAFVRAPFSRGTAGRVAFRQSDFFNLGGYDERMEFGWGYDDRDIRGRALGFGLKEIVIPNDQGWLVALQHSFGERTRFAAEKDAKISDARHKRLASESIETGNFVANAGKRWGEARLQRNFCGKWERTNPAKAT